MGGTRSAWRGRLLAALLTCGGRGGGGALHRVTDLEGRGLAQLLGRVGVTGGQRKAWSTWDFPAKSRKVMRKG